jgi:hypothetical protein
MRNKVMNGKAPSYTGQQCSDLSLPGKCPDPAIEENYDVRVSFSNRSKPISERFWFFLTFHNYLRPLITIHVCTDDVLVEANYQRMQLRFFQPVQQVKEVLFEASEFGGLRKNKHYFLASGFWQGAGFFIPQYRTHHLAFTDSHGLFIALH